MAISNVNIIIKLKLKYLSDGKHQLLTILLLHNKTRSKLIIICTPGGKTILVHMCTSYRYQFQSPFGRHYIKVDFLIFFFIILNRYAPVRQAN